MLALTATACRISRWACQGPLLEMPGEYEQEGQQQAQEAEQSPAPAPQDAQDPQQLAGIGQHPHDPVRIQGVDGISVIDEHRGGLPAGIAEHVIFGFRALTKAQTRTTRHALRGY